MITINFLVYIRYTQYAERIFKNKCPLFEDLCINSAYFLGEKKMLNNSVLHIAPLAINLFFILGVFIFYEVLFDGVRLALAKTSLQVSSTDLPSWLGVIYMLILLLSFQATIFNSPTNWLFINFQITALVFCAILLNVPLKYHILIPIILLFMIFNSAIFYWESWCFGLTIIGFYSSLKYIKDKRQGHFPFLFYILDTLVFGFILWTLAKIKFSLDSVVVLRQLTYMAFFAVFAISYIGLILRNHRIKSSLYYFASHDELTRSANLALFNADSERLYNQSFQKQIPVTMMMFDIDHFKQTNDEYGHLAGDQVLQKVVDVTQDVISNSDIQIKLYRTGGEEFNVVFPDYTVNQAREIIEEIFKNINSSIIIYKNEAIQINISAGVSQLTTTDSSPRAFYDRVDTALYKSKRNGRDQITWE